jgi:hypothetical protein
VPATIAAREPFTAPSPAIKSTRSIEPAAAIESVEPRAGADKCSAHEIVRTVVAIGRAGIRRVVIIAIRANRRRPNVRRPHSESNSDSNLRAGGSRDSHAEPEQHRVF